VPFYKNFYIYSVYILKRIHLKKYIFLFLTVFSFIQAFSQDYVAHKSDVGISVGALTYTGKYSEDATFLDHTSLGVSAFYSHRIVLPKKLFLRGQLSLGELAADNTKDMQSSNPFKGGFRSYNLEGSANLVYEVLDNNKFKVTPYAMAGGGIYYLFDYEAKQGDDKSSKDLWGLVVPVGGGIKYRATKRLRVFAEGSLRLFPKNLDNFPYPDVENTNRYYSLSLGVSYTLQDINRLW